MSEPNFSPETIDEQTGQHANRLPPEEAHLVHDLHRVYQPLAESNARSLERVRARLAQHEARLQHSFPQRSPTKEAYMKTLLRTFSPGSAWRRGISVAAAVLVLTVLVGSMVTLFALQGHGKNTANHRQQQNTPAVTATTTPAPPEPTPTPGMYMITDHDNGDYWISKIDQQTRKSLWTQDVGAISSSIVVYGDTVYVTAGDPTLATYDNYVYALNANTGVVRWKVTLSNHIIKGVGDVGVLTTPVLANGILYVGARDGKLYALDASKGSRLWVYDAHAIAFADGSLFDANQAAVNQGVIYGAIHNVLYAVNAKTGKQLWTVTIDSKQIFNGPTLANGVLYLSSYEESNYSDPSIETGYAYAYSAKDGKQRWRHSVGALVLCPPTVDNNVVYFGSFNFNLYALKASDGSELWHYNTQGEIFEPPIVDNGIVYTAETGNANEGSGASSTVKPALLAINASSGTLVWQKAVKNLSSLQTVQNGVIYLGVWPGQLYVLKANDGSVLWHQKFGPTLIDKTGTESEAAPIVTVIS